MTRFIARQTLIGIMALGAAGLQADVLNLRDGSRLVGVLERIDDAEATLSGTFAGELSVPREHIVSIETDAPVTVQLTDEAYLSGRLEAADSGTVLQVTRDLGARPLPMSDVKGIYRADPQTVQRELAAVRVTANLNAGIGIASGNSNTDNYHIDGTMVARTPRNRYTVAAEYNHEEAEDILVKQNWLGLIKYDYFISDQWFFFNSATFESDEFADLELRSALAAGMGYQFFESDTRSLSIEAGPSYIDENYEDAEDQSFVGARWAINYNQHLWDGISFFHYDEGLMGLEDTDDISIRSRTGFNMEVTERVIAKLQTAIDWDNTPPEGTKSTDYEHTLTIGYRF